MDLTGTAWSENSDSTPALGHATGWADACVRRYLFHMRRGGCLVLSLLCLYKCTSKAKGVMHYSLGTSIICILLSILC